MIDPKAVRRAARRALTVEGQITEIEARKLVELAAGVPHNRVIVEIGSYRGRSTVALALGSQLGSGVRVYAIDPHVPFKGVKGGKFGPADMAALYANIARLRLGEIIAVVALPSAMVAKGWTQHNIGLLWIDGDHRYSAVRADFDNWWGYVSRDGIIAFHDSTTKGVAKLLAELEANAPLKAAGRVRELSWYRRE